MRKTTEKTEKIRHFIISHIPEHPDDVVALTCERFGISRQAVNRHIHHLVKTGKVKAAGNTKNRSYSLIPFLIKSFTHKLTGLEEHKVWSDEIKDLLNNLPENLIDIWHYGLTEMVNNAIDHSEGETVTVKVTRNAIQTEIVIHDDGIGIFRKIMNGCGLDDERQSVLELAKGKLTTDPDNHTGEGIFFSSRAFDDYAILSGEVYFSHVFDEEEDWILERDKFRSGTSIFMKMSDNSKRQIDEVFNQYASSDEDYGFTKTVVPVKLVKQGEEKLVSRSQAKRLMSRVDKFKTVLLDFRDIDSIGQAFADEVFRVFQNNHPGIRIVPIYENDAISKMIKRVLINENPDQTKL